MDVRKLMEKQSILHIIKSSVGYLYKYKLVVALIEMILIISLLRGIFIINQGWWNLAFFIIPIAIGLIVLYRDELNKRPLLNRAIRYLLLWSSLFSFIFAVLMAFISPFWWVGLLLSILFLGGAYFGPFESIDDFSHQHKKRLIIAITLFWLLFMVGYLPPSYYANDHQNPKEKFSSTYYAVDSYDLYSSGGVKDREHVIPQYWYSTNVNNYVNDYVNVIWSNKMANNYRGYLPFGEIDKNETTSILDNEVVVGYRNRFYFMPIDEYKGDVARIVLYMYITYKDDGLPVDKINIPLMQAWSRLDPVDSREIERNETIYVNYGYRNKFVTNPWLISFVV